MNTRRIFRPNLDPARLEPRLPLSQTSGLFSTLTQTALNLGNRGRSLVSRVESLGHSLPSRGVLAGTYSMAVASPDIGTSAALTGAGRVAPLGNVQVTGFLQGPGFIRDGRTTGFLIFANSHGSVTVLLEGSPGSGLTSTSTLYSLGVESGTGIYAGASGQGRLAIALKPSLGSTGLGGNGQFHVNVLSFHLVR